MIEINPTLFLDESELSFEFIKASGPGGQNINKVSSAVRLRFNIQRTEILNLVEKERFILLAGNRITDDGDLIIEARSYRSQERNRQDALKRFIGLVRSSLLIPKARIKTHPSKSVRGARTNSKKKHGMLKYTRRKIPEDWE